MKQIIYILLTTTMLGLMSCSDWLDVSPKTSIPTDKQFESESNQDLRMRLQVFI